MIVHRDDGREWARCNAVACELVRYRSEPAFDPTVYCPEVGCLVYIELAKGHEVERSVFATPDDDALLSTVVVEPPPPAIVHVGPQEDRIEIDLDADGTPDAAHALGAATARCPTTSARCICRERAR